MRFKSSWFRSQAQALSAEETPLYLFEISHPLAVEPLRVVHDSQDVVSRGKNFVACSFDVGLPDDNPKQTPHAAVSIDNTDRSIGAFFERTNGARGASFRLMQIMRSQPDVLEEDMLLDMRNVVVNSKVSAQLGFDDVLNKPGVQATYRPETAPGLF